MLVSDPWCVASSDQRLPLLPGVVLRWSWRAELLPGHVLGQVLARGQRPRGTSFDPGPCLLLGAAQSFPVAKAAQHRLKEKTVQNPVGFWWASIQTNAPFHRTSHGNVSPACSIPLGASRVSQAAGALCRGGAGQSRPGSPGCCFPLSCQNKVLLRREWCNFTLCCLNPIEIISISPFPLQMHWLLALVSLGPDALWCPRVTLWWHLNEHSPPPPPLTMLLTLLSAGSR